jgi:agmatinase
LRDFDADLPFSGIDTFAHLNWTNCFAPESNGTCDIAIVGAPFDLSVSYRPGARFGPTGARMGARRISPSAGWESVHVYLPLEPFGLLGCMDHGVNLFKDWAAVTDCGDIPNTAFDKLLAIQELESGWNSINAQSPKNRSTMDAVRVISIGGYHTISEWFCRRFLLR